MPQRGSRQLTIVAVLLVLPLLASATALLLPAHGHECAFDKECLKCRWAADTVAEIEAPVAQTPLVLSPDGAHGPGLEARHERTREALASRGPPSAV